MDVHMKNLVQVQSIMASEHLSLVDLRTIVGLMEQSTGEEREEIEALWESMVAAMDPDDYQAAWEEGLL